MTSGVAHNDSLIGYMDHTDYDSVRDFMTKCRIEHPTVISNIEKLYNFSVCYF